MKSPEVDYGLCIGCGFCAEQCPEVFELRDEKAWVIDGGSCDSCDCEEVISTCPVHAISWED
ncbi:MAG: ferredoxin [Proteobacteria bacterium]|nr:ferredoxin [Pseudomonadota bacterium]MBU1737396.1 ferredoxin [Pseudomonadota bacterium]